MPPNSAALDYVYQTVSCAQVIINNRFDWLVWWPFLSSISPPSLHPTTENRRHEKTNKVISDVLWASGNDWDREWIQQVVALLVGHGAFTLYPALSQCDNAAERLTRWLTFQLPRVKQAHPGCPIHQWLNSIGAQVIVEKWQSPEQWPNLYWLPLPEVDDHAQGGLVLLPAHFLPVYMNGTIQTNTLQANTPANACIFWCITPWETARRSWFNCRSGGI